MEQQELFDLIEKGRSGDRRAQEKLVTETQNRVYYHCKKMLKNEEDALDATQDVLITMITSLDKLREPAAFWGWVNGITANRCKHLLTQGTKEWQIPEDEEGNSLLDSIEDLDEQVVPDKVMDNAETQRLIMEIIDSLPPEQKMAVLLYYYDEMSVKEIAQATEVSEGTVKSRLNYARKSIKDGVEKLAKKGTKLYGISPLPFLAYFLRRAMAAESLPPAMAGPMAQEVMAAGTAAGATAGTAAGATAGTAGTAGTAAGAAAATGTAGSASAGGAAAAAGVAAKGIIGSKIALGLAGLAVAGTVVGSVALSGRPASPDPTPTPVSTAAMTVVTPAPGPEVTPAPELEAYAEAYAQKVRELLDTPGSEDYLYGLVYIDGDSSPELIAGTPERVNVYTISNGALYTIREGWSMGRLGVPEYYPGENAVREHYSSMGGGGGTRMDITDIYFQINGDLEVEEFFRSEGEVGDNGSYQAEIPARLAGLTPERLAGSMSAEEILALLGSAPTGAASISDLPTKYREDYENGEFLEVYVTEEGVVYFGSLLYTDTGEAFMVASAGEETLITNDSAGSAGYAQITVTKSADLALKCYDNEEEARAGRGGSERTFQNATVRVMEDNGRFWLEITSASSSRHEFTIENGRLIRYSGPGGNVVIPDGVTVIGDQAFQGHRTVTSVTIPYGVTTIEGTETKISENTVHITGAFSECPKLTTVTIPDSVTEIGVFAFRYSGLTAITIPASVDTIGTGAFSYCNDLTELVLSDGVRTIGASAFLLCRSLTDVTIPESVEKIDYTAFSGCSSLSSVTILNKDAVIRSNAFSSEGQVLTIYGKSGSTAEARYSGAEASDRIRFVALDASKQTPASGDFEIKNGALISYNGPGGDVVIPEGVTSIRETAFHTYGGAANVIMSDGRARFSVYPVRTNLTSVTLPSSMTEVSIKAFAGCTSLADVTIPDSVTKIGSTAFANCTSLTKVTLPESVTFVSEFAFADTGLTSITIPDTVTQLGDWAFINCTSLTSATFLGDTITLGSGVFDLCPNLTIYAHTGSIAEAYANKNHIPFVALDASESTEHEFVSENFRFIKPAASLSALYSRKSKDP